MVVTLLDILGPKRESLIMVEAMRSPSAREKGVRSLVRILKPLGTLFTITYLAMALVGGLTATITLDVDDRLMGIDSIISMESSLFLQAQMVCTRAVTVQTQSKDWSHTTT